MPLAGTFDVLDFGETLRLLSRPSFTGRLHLRSGALHATVVIVEGQAAGADLGGTNGGGDGLRNWRPLLDDICFEALRAGRGSFEYQQDDTVEAVPGGHAPLDEVVAAGERRLAQWKEVEGVIPSFDAVPRLNESLRADRITIDRDGWRLLVAIDGRRSVAGLARRLSVDVLGMCQLLKPLVEDGAVVFDASDRRTTPLPSVRLDHPTPPPVPEATPEGDVSAPAVAAAATAGTSAGSSGRPPARPGLSRLRGAPRPAGAAPGA